MTRSRLLFLLLYVTSILPNVYGQTTYTCNSRYKISLPNKLKLQDSELNTINTESERINISTSSGHITFQQKGLNDNVSSAFSKYCRVIIEYFTESKQDPTFGMGDKIVVDRDILYAVNEAAEQNCKASGTPLIKLISVESLSINGFPVLYYSYKRKGWEGKQPPVIVNVYRIFNKYESVTLTFSYREQERNLWSDIHDNIQKTFTFTRKY